jgi:hypothetical protein
MKKIALGIALLFSISLLFGNILIHGEKFLYDVKFGVIAAGRASLNTEKVQYKGNDAWKVYTTAESNSVIDKIYKVRDYIESISTIDSLYSLQFTKRLEEGTYRQHRVHTNFLREKYSIYTRLNFKSNVYNTSKMPIPSNTHDLLSALYKARTYKLEPGQSHKMNVTVDGRNYDALVNVLRRETISTIYGKDTQCLVVEPALEGEAIFKQTGNIYVYLTDDDKKIPVLLQSKTIFGSFKGILTEVRY